MTTSYRRINIDYVKPSPYNTRIYFDEDSLEGLAESIENHDQIQPLVVRPMEDGRFEIVSGERRYRALKKGGSKYADCIVKDLTDSEAMWYQLEENREREDYSDFENALKMQQLIEEDGLTQEELAEKLGISQAHVSRYLQMLKIDEIIPAGIKSEFLHSISERQAREILTAPEEIRADMAEEVANQFEFTGHVMTAAEIKERVDAYKSIRESYSYRPETTEEPDLPELRDPIRDLDEELEEEVKEEQELGQELELETEEKEELEVEIDWFSDFDDLRDNWWWPYVEEAMERSLTHIANNYILRNLENLKQQDASNQALKEFLKQECSHHGHSGPGDPTLRGTPKGLEVNFKDDPEWNWRQFDDELKVKITWGGLLRKANMMLYWQEKEESEGKLETETVVETESESQSEAEPELESGAGLDKQSRVFRTIRHMFSEFGKPDPMFVRSVIAHEHDLTDSEATILYTKYMKQQEQEQEQEKEGMEAPEAKPGPELESEPEPEEAVTGSFDVGGSVCPLCGQSVSERRMAVIEDLLENLGAEEVMNRILNAAKHSREAQVA